MAAVPLALRRASPAGRSRALAAGAPPLATRPRGQSGAPHDGGRSRDYARAELRDRQRSGAAARDLGSSQIGRASGRERAGQYVEISVLAGSDNKNTLI